MAEKLFVSVDNNHKISTCIVDEHSAIIDIVEFKYERYKSFLLLFGQVIEYLHKKNIKYIKQNTKKEEVSLFKNYIDKQELYFEDIIVLTFNIADYPKIFYNAIGVQLI